VYKRLVFIGLIATLPWLSATGAEPGAGGGAVQGNTGTWAILKSPLPGGSEVCPDAQDAGSGLIKVPLFSERSAACPVAKVGDDMIPLDDLTRALASSHQSGSGEAKAGRTDATAILNRLIDVRLIVQEARAMGVDEDPEVVKGLRSIEERVGRDLLKERVLKDVKPSRAETTRFFQEAAREWQLQSILVLRETDAQQMAKQIKAGASYDAVAAKAVAEKKATGNEPGAYVHWSKLVPQVLAALQKTKVGKTTPPIKVPGGWTIVNVKAVRYPEDAKLRAEAEQRSLLEERKKVLKAYYDGLVKKYVKIDEKLLRKIDYEAKKPGIAALAKDTRVLARIEGKPPVTVGDLTSKLAEQQYHGLDTATQQKKLNKNKGTTLDAILSVPVVVLETERLGIPKTAEYRLRVDSEFDALVFGTFIQKVVVPGVKVTVGDVRKYYEAHTADYTQPSFYRIEAIGFARQKDAEAAVAMLRSGTDFKWLNANAEGKIQPGKDGNRPPLVVSSKGMTPEFAKALDGARKGDYRLYAPHPDQSYAIQVVDIVPATLQPLEQVQGEVGDRVYGEAVQKSVEEWLGKLRKVHAVQIYLTRISS